MLSARGRKGTNKAEQLSVLKQLAEVTKRPSKLVELLGHVIAFNFDMHMNMLTAMPTKVRRCARRCNYCPRGRSVQSTHPPATISSSPTHPSTHPSTHPYTHPYTHPSTHPST